MKQITTRTAKIRYDRNQILIIKILNGIKMDYEDAADNILVVRHLTEDNPCLKLIDSRADFIIERKAQKFLESKEVKKKTRARAIVVTGKMKKLLLSFFYSLNTNKAPAKIFTDYHKAYEWLLSLRESDTPPNPRP